MAGSGDLLSKVKRFREVDTVQHESVASVPEALEKWSKFLIDHETPSANDCTHTVFDNYMDWWMGSKPNYRLTIVEDNTVNKLYQCISELYNLGIPLTLAEKRTPEIRFVQDIEIWGTRNTTVSVEDLMDAQSRFARLLGKTMGEIYDKQPFLDVVIFDASGMSRTKGVMKTSARLVWSSIVVDKDRAGRIRDYVVHKFKDSKDEDIRALEEQITGYNTDNHWNGVFCKAIYFGPFGIRMPLCDRVSPAPLKKPEQRPFRPVGVVRFEYADGDVESIDRICGKDELDGTEWLKIGCIRRDAGSALTDWTLPTWKGERAPRSCNNTPSTVTAASLASRTPGQVKVRTKSGSGDGGTVARLRTTKPEQERPVMIGEFEGTLEEFRERLLKDIGMQEDQITEADGILKWKSEENGVRIEFKASNRRVYAIGSAHQVRALLRVIAPMVRGVGESARSTTTARPASSQRAGSEYGAPSAAYAPSAVYAPSSVHAPSQAYASSTASHGSTVREGGHAENSKRVAIQAFEPQSAGELALAMNDCVTVEHDPKDGQHNMDRWVFGLNETTNGRGWFQMSATKPLQITTTEAEASGQ